LPCSSDVPDYHDRVNSLDARALVAGFLLLVSATSAADVLPPAPVPPLPAATLPPSSTFTGKKFPPPGSPADQALLGELLEAQATMLSQRAWAITATQRLADGGYDGRLAAVQQTAEPARAEAVRSARETLTAAWNRVTGIMTGKWPVDGRIGCRPQGVDFEVLMAGDAQASQRLATTRASARACLDKQRPILKSLGAANRDLDAAWREARSILAGATGTPSGAGATQAGRDR
jgi:hypothetical protein